MSGSVCGTLPQTVFGPEARAGSAGEAVQVEAEARGREAAVVAISCERAWKPSSIVARTSGRRQRPKPVVETPPSAIERAEVVEPVRAGRRVVVRSVRISKARWYELPRQVVDLDDHAGLSIICADQELAERCQARASGSRSAAGIGGTRSCGRNGTTVSERIVREASSMKSFGGGAK